LNPEVNGTTPTMKSQPKTLDVTDGEIIANYAAGYSMTATRIMLDVPEARVRRVIAEAGIARKRSGVRGLIFSIKHMDYVPRDFVWDIEEIIRRREQGIAWSTIHRSMKITWHIESLIRYVTEKRPEIKVKGKGVSPAKTLNDSQIAQVIKDHEAGETYRSIFRRLKISENHFFTQLRAYKQRMRKALDEESTQDP
jgi:hypothetical protein